METLFLCDFFIWPQYTVQPETALPTPYIWPCRVAILAQAEHILSTIKAGYRWEGTLDAKVFGNRGFRVEGSSHGELEAFLFLDLVCTESCEPVLWLVEEELI